MIFLSIRKPPFRSDIIREQCKINKNIKKTNLKRSNKSYEQNNNSLVFHNSSRRHEV